MIQLLLRRIILKSISAMNPAPYQNLITRWKYFYTQVCCVFSRVTRHKPKSIRFFSQNFSKITALSINLSKKSNLKLVPISSKLTASQSLNEKKLLSKFHQFSMKTKEMATILLIFLNLSTYLPLLALKLKFQKSSGFKMSGNSTAQQPI